jgi:hypothetical protein
MNAVWLPLLLLAARPTVTSASSCPSARDIDSNLAALLPEQAGLPGTAAIRPASDGLLVDLRPETPALAAQRAVVVGSNCEDRAKAAAVVIATHATAGSSTRRTGIRCGFAGGCVVSAEVPPSLRRY